MDLSDHVPNQTGDEAYNSYQFGKVRGLANSIRYEPPLTSDRPTARTTSYEIPVCLYLMYIGEYCPNDVTTDLRVTYFQLLIF
jgi:hypothetical protein